MRYRVVTQALGSTEEIPLGIFSHQQVINFMELMHIPTAFYESRLNAGVDIYHGCEFGYFEFVPYLVPDETLPNVEPQLPAVYYMEIIHVGATEYVYRVKDDETFMTNDVQNEGINLTECISYRLTRIGGGLGTDEVTVYGQAPDTRAGWVVAIHNNRRRLQRAMSELTSLHDYMDWNSFRRTVLSTAYDD